MLYPPPLSPAKQQLEFSWEEIFREKAEELVDTEKALTPPPLTLNKLRRYIEQDVKFHQLRGLNNDSELPD